MNLVTRGPLAPLPPKDGPGAFVTRELWDAIRARIAELETENSRLRTWLRYIAGNFRNGPECAEQALRGEPPPSDFEG